MKQHDSHIRHAYRFFLEHAGCCTPGRAVYGKTNDTEPPVLAEMQQSVAREMAHRLADYFGADNPRFDRARFLAACGVQP